jgi:hypothetical protein
MVEKVQQNTCKVSYIATNLLRARACYNILSGRSGLYKMRRQLPLTLLPEYVSSAVTQGKPIALQEKPLHA